MKIDFKKFNDKKKKELKTTSQFGDFLKNLKLQDIPDIDQFATKVQHFAIQQVSMKNIQESNKLHSLTQGLPFYCSLRRYDTDDGAKHQLAVLMDSGWYLRINIDIDKIKK